MNGIHYLDPNPGGYPVVLLLHGLGATSISWQFQLASLAGSGFRPIAPDLPGFGESALSGHSWSIPGVANSMVDLVNQLGVESAHIVGLSMGGVIAQEIARSHAHVVKKLVLVSTFSALRPESLDAWIYFLLRAFLLLIFGLSVQARRVALRVFPKPDQGLQRKLLEETIASSDKRAYKSAMFSLGRFDSRRWLGEIKAQTLIISGNDDTTVSPERQRLLKNGIPGARQVIINEAGHAVSVDQAEQFNAELIRFLTEL